MRIGVTALHLACCATESAAAMRLDFPFERDGLSVAAAEPGDSYDLSVLLVAGTVTKAGVGQVLRAWERMPEPRAAIAFGVCAASGGPYWDSPLVVPGVGEVLPVSRVVPGCPPPRAAVLDAILAVAGEHARA